jgi:ligand-binding sensor domain-containing protein/signal transduction histidine kinase
LPLKITDTVFINKRGWFTFVILLILSCIFSAKAQQFVFNRTPLFEENVRGFITSMAQDSKGYMWFTGTSLYRYDGYRVVTYKNDPLNPQSISPSRLECIYIGNNDVIWLGTVGSGLDRFDPSTGIFTHYRNEPGNPSSLSNNIVTAILEDNEGDLWVGTHGGLNLLDKKTGKFTRFQKNYNDSTSLSNNQVRALYQDKKGVIWVGCGSPYNNETPPGEGGLNRFDKKTGKFTNYLHNPNDANTLSDNKVKAIYEDSRGIFWVGTFGDGLHTMDREKGIFKRYNYDPLHPEKLSSPHEKGNYHGVSFITEDKAGGIWIGAFLAGLNHFDPKTSKLTRLKAESNNAQALGENTIWYAAFSKEGVLWITTQSNVYRTDPLRKNIKHTEIAERVHAFHEDAAGILWIASDTGLIRQDRRNGTTHYYTNDPKDAGSISSNVVVCIYEDKEGTLWIGTDKGLDLFNKQINKFYHYKPGKKNQPGLNNTAIFSILQDQQGAFWLATDDGLNVLNRRTGSVKHFRNNPSDTNSLSSNAVYKIMEDKSGNIWVATWGNGGLNLLDKKSGHFKRYLQGNNIVDLFEDSNGTLWIGTQFGLYYRNKSTGEFLVFSDPASGIGTTNIAGIVEDDKKNLWLGSQSAIIKLNLHNNQTSIYGRKYGIIPNSIYDLVSYKSRRGELFFGDARGYFTFFPNDLTANALPPQIQITDLKVADISLRPGQPPLTTSIEQMGNIKLNYKQDIFSLDFAAIHYSSIEENRDLFMLEGYDTKWRKAGSEKTASYFNVPPGEYVFKIKASSSDGVWAEKWLKIIITPPWWHTWWAYLFYAILLTASIGAIINYRSRSLINEKRQLEQQVKIRTAEIVKQKEEIARQRDNLEHTLGELRSAQDQLVQREKMASLGELTAGIAHQIKNPLNFINNFSEVSIELMNEMENELKAGDKEEALHLAADIKQNLQRVADHGQRADAIVKGMLQHSRSSTGQKEPTDINALADEYLRLSYHGLRAKDKSFHANFKEQFDESIDKAEVVPQEIGRVFLNLFNNAFYAVNERKNQLNGTFEPTVTVSTKKIENKPDNYRIEICIKDNGTGIPGKALDKIFQPFFTTKPAGQGTGLGLSLSYDIIKAHGGEIKVETKEGEGSAFIISIPLM